MSDNGEFGMNILVFEGGGAGGLSGLFILSEIMGRVVAAGGDRRIRKTFTVVAGTGTGALYVCMLGRLRIELEQTIITFVKLVKDVFSDRKMISMSDTAAYKAAKLETALKQIVKDATGDENTRMIDTLLNAEECRTMIFAMSKHNMTASAPRIFRSYQGVANQMPNCTVWEALRATMAHPDLFKSIQIGGPSMPEELIGGDVGCSNPISHVLAEVGAIYPNRHIASIICIGAGHARTIQIPKPNPLQRLVPTNVLAAMKNIAMDSERAAEEMAVRFQSTKGVYFRFNVDQGMQSVKMGEWQRQGEVVAHARAYTMKGEVTGRIDRAIQSMKEKKAALETSCMMVKIQQPSPQQISGVKLCPAPSPLFTGCDSQVTQITTCLIGPPGERRICVIHGLGGVGKTQISLQAVEKTKSHWRDIVYVDATSQETTSNTLKAFATAKHTGETHEDAIRWLERHAQPWLLVFDNADDPDLGLPKFIPQGSHGSVLITTRLRSLALLGQGPNSAVNVGGMRPEDALELLLKKARVQDRVLLDEEMEAATGLTKDLGYLALAIVHAGAYIWCSDIAFAKYRRQCLEHPQVALQKYSKTPGYSEKYEKTVYTTWLMSYERLKPRTKHMLCLLGFLHHDWIVEDIFRNAATNKTYHPGIPPSDDELVTHGEVREYLDSFLDTDGGWNSDAFLSVMDELLSYSLVNHDRVNDTYGLHVLVQSWAGSVTLGQKGAGLEQISFLMALSIDGSPETANRASRRGLSLHVGRLLNGRSQGNANNATQFARAYRDNGEWGAEERLLVQVVEARKRVLGDDDPNTLTSMSELALTYWNQGRWDEAEALGVQILERRKRVLGEDHPDTLTTTNNLASTYWKQGRWGESEALEVQVLETRKRVLGEDHPDTLISMNNLAFTYSNQGRWDEAEALEKQVLETRKRVLGEDHPDTLTSMSNLASTYSYQGRRDEAEALEVQVLETRKRVLGEDHPNTLTIMNNLASTYSNQGRWDESEALALQVLEARKRILGEVHPDTLTSMGNLAFTYSDQGRWNEAEALEVQVLEISKRVLGEDHPSTLTSTGNLASTYRNQGRWDEAEALEVQVLETRKRVLGEDHLYTLTSMSNLASTYSNQGRWNEAEALQVRVLETRKRMLGQDHPSTLTSMSNLASTYSYQGRWDEAEALELNVLETEKRVLGEDHPSTLVSMSNLASTYSGQCRWDEAEALHTRALEKRQRVLGEDHPDTLISMSNLALTYSNQGRWDQAEALHVQVLETKIRVLGEQHPSTLTSMCNLASAYSDQGRWDEAEAPQLRALDASKRLLGLKHPDTFTAMCSLVRIYEHIGLRRRIEWEALQKEISAI